MIRLHDRRGENICPLPRHDQGGERGAELLLLWPDAENFPVCGEIDFMEMMDDTRQKTNIFLHYGKDHKQVSGEVKNRHHAVARLVAGMDPHPDRGVPRRQRMVEHHRDGQFPRGAMHLCVQLDWFPKGGDAQQSQTFVDWVKYYPISPDKA